MKTYVINKQKCLHKGQLVSDCNVYLSHVPKNKEDMGLFIFYRDLY